MQRKAFELPNIESSEKITQFKYFFILLSLFSSTWLIANIAAVKLVTVFGITLTGGFMVFPLTTMLSNIIVEVYGYKNARQAIWSGFILNLSFIFFINIIDAIPPSQYWPLDRQFHNILIPERRIIFASLIAFLLSDFSNSYLMAKMKIKNHGESLLNRILISSCLSISIDITCFILLAFSGTMPTSVLGKLMIAVYLKKIFCQILLFPCILGLINLLKNKETIEIYDYDTKFNPFSLDNEYRLDSFKKYNTAKTYTLFPQKLLRKS